MRWLDWALGKHDHIDFVPADQIRKDVGSCPLQIPEQKSKHPKPNLTPFLNARRLPSLGKIMRVDRLTTPSRVGYPKISADLSCQEIVDFPMSGHGRGLVVCRVHVHAVLALVAQ
jgi:hypothetical protein